MKSFIKPKLYKRRRATFDIDTNLVSKIFQKNQLEPTIKEEEEDEEEEKEKTEAINSKDKMIREQLAEKTVTEIVNKCIQSAQ